MTERRDLKARVRERQAQTGESYMEALRQVQASRPSSPIPVVELLDLTDLAVPLGLKCKIVMYPELAARVDPATVLARLRDALLVTGSASDLRLMRGVVLFGQRPKFQLSYEGILELVARVKAGIGGVGGNGCMLALTIDGKRGREAVLFMLSLSPPFVSRDVDPTLIITTFDMMFGGALAIDL